MFTLLLNIPGYLMVGACLVQETFEEDVYSRTEDYWLPNDRRMSVLETFEEVVCSRADDNGFPIDRRMSVQETFEEDVCSRAEDNWLPN